MNLGVFLIRFLRRIEVNGWNRLLSEGRNQGGCLVFSLDRVFSPAESPSVATRPSALFENIQLVPSEHNRWDFHPQADIDGG
jgi:hypothetical protein